MVQKINYKCGGCGDILQHLHEGDRSEDGYIGEVCKKCDTDNLFFIAAAEWKIVGRHLSVFMEY